MIFEQILLLFQNYGIGIVAVISFVDGLPGVGFIIPDEIVLALVGFSANSAGSIITLILISSIAMIFAQLVNYKLGEYYGFEVLKRVGFNQQRKLKLEYFMAENPLFTNYLGRFSSTLRAAIAIISGMNQVSISRFIAQEIPITLIKSSLYIMLGVFFGSNEDNLKLLTERIGILVLLVISINFIISVYSSRKLLVSKLPEQNHSSSNS